MDFWISASATSLVSLPDRLTVGGFLDLSGCASLVSLPDGLTVGRDLHLNDCTSLVCVPNRMDIGGSVFGAPSPTGIPAFMPSR